MSDNVSFKAPVLLATVDADWTYPWITVRLLSQLFVTWYRRSSLPKILSIIYVCRLLPHRIQLKAWQLIVIWEINELHLVWHIVEYYVAHKLKPLMLFWDGTDWSKQHSSQMGMCCLRLSSESAMIFKRSSLSGTCFGLWLWHLPNNRGIFWALLSVAIIEEPYYYGDPR